MRQVMLLLLLTTVVLVLALAQVTDCRLRHHSRQLNCSRCAPGWGVVRRCSPTVDTQCAPCGPSSYSPHHSYHAPCWPCSHCGRGLYEARTCTNISDTVCDSCQRLKFLHSSKECS